ncbi:MAG: biotin--[acetyl-CoA-carboxylase] ligase [Roseibacillus sp.]
MGDYDLELLHAELGERLQYFSELGSTNEQALEMGREGMSSGAVVLAGKQWAGRGRRGAAWFCSEGAGLAFTIVLRPDFEKALWPRLSLVAGMAVAKSIEAAGLAPEIKWPNDVLIGGRKVCGILVEAEGDFVVVGIGLNVGAMEVPEELSEIATSLAKEGAQEVIREEYLLEILKSFESLEKLVKSDFASLISMVRSRCALAGKEVEFLDGQERRRGRCEGIGEAGDLQVWEDRLLKRYVAADQIRVVSSL